MLKVILITGSNANIGFELVHLLAKENVVYMTSRNEASGKESQCIIYALYHLHVIPTALVMYREELKKDGLHVKLIQLNITNFNLIKAAKNVIEKGEGKLDVLVNNAGNIPTYISNTFAKHVIHNLCLSDI
jgi:NAD(P)-dependent dehydrogenase (short-subunit alcohol dehydrogenase family)